MHHMTNWKGNSERMTSDRYLKCVCLSLARKHKNEEEENSLKRWAKQVSEAITVWCFILEAPVRVSARFPVIITEICHVYPWSFQAKCRYNIYE
jgi:hypothetical protein